ncbi:MAG: transporter related [Gammaproteobacteria bacterium]|jgi:ABC-2 type transport system ATP-binding protein|nr:transporter related [Gammaproteobacteria bacterium]
MIYLDELNFGYKKHNDLFHHLKLMLNAGSICGLLGENGSGKTTLLKILAGLIFPSSGNCQVMGQTPSKRLPQFLQELYFLPEDIYVPAITAEQYVNFYATFYPRFNHELLKQCLAEFEIPSQQLLTELSHGQKKKFLMSFGIATNCRLLIFDEPTNGLDIPSKSQFRKLLASNFHEDRLFIISTHQVHDVENLIDTVIIIENGEVIFQQSLENITQKLAFTEQADMPEINDYFYYEKKLGGYFIVKPNTGQQDTRVDLETLFNTVRTNKAKIQQYFAQG